MKTTILISVFALGVFNLNAQDSSKTNPLTISAYVEAYYSYDLGNPGNHERPAFFYSYNRHNETNLNLGFVKANYTTEKVRGNLALMVGTYPQYNLALEQGLLKNIFEANVGFKISKNKNIWVDAGVMPSHIGFESAIGKDCWNLTRSLLAENSPYYESGIKLSYASDKENLYLAVMYLNGWQKIQRLSGNQTPAFGSQFTYKPNSKVTLNWSTFFGNDLPDSLRRYRIFNNFYGQYQLTNKFGLTAGFDVGMQQIKKDTNAYYNWYSPVIILQYKLTDKIRIAARGEYYSDEKGVIIATGTTHGFKTLGYSLNFDYVFQENALWRIEARGLTSEDKIFSMGNKASNQNYFITTAFAISF